MFVYVCVCVCMRVSACVCVRACVCVCVRVCAIAALSVGLEKCVSTGLIEQKSLNSALSFVTRTRTWARRPVVRGSRSCSWTLYCYLQTCYRRYVGVCLPHPHPPTHNHATLMSRPCLLYTLFHSKCCHGAHTHTRTHAHTYTHTRVRAHTHAHTHTRK